MNVFSRIFGRNFFIKIKSWEYWPFGIIQAPLFPYWLWLSLKARSLVFFSASNPGILMGGMFGESKFEVLEKIPGTHKPKTLLVKVPSSVEEIVRRIRENSMEFPLIFKPDLGERGWMVKKITSPGDVVEYLKEIKINFLVQEMVSLPLEFGVFYVRYPTEPSGKVTSIVGKEMLSVTGNGNKTLKQLIMEKDRARLQWVTLQNIYRNQVDKIIPSDESIELVSMGNHCLGTKFLNANHLITEKLSASFDSLSKQIDGFYFGRFDLRASSVEDLENGRFQVMELNGCGAEPSHIYHPGFSLPAALSVLFRHWSDIYRISRENHQRGVDYISFREARMIYKAFKASVAK